MASAAILPFIADKDLFAHAEKLVRAAKNGENKVNKNPYTIVIDPFSALIDAARQKMSLEIWIEQEKSRQIQKSFQNAVGDFHRDIIGSMQDWENAGSGGSFDVINEKQKIIAEIKNKHNTMNSTSQLGTYDKMANWLDYGKSGYTAYVVDVVPKKPSSYSLPFIPSERKVKRQTRSNLLRIDGRSFYALAARNKNSLELLYSALPQVLSKILGVSEKTLKGTSEFRLLFEKAYIK